MKASIAMLAAVACVAGMPSGHAQGYPGKPIRMIVPFPPGGATDIVARILGQKLTEQVGQPVVIDNRPGAAGTLGAELAARAAPDGYTLFMGSSSNISVAPSLYPQLKYDPLRDFAPVTIAAMTPYLLLVQQSSAIRSVPDLIKAAQAQPGKLTFGSGGAGTPDQLAGELFRFMAKVQAVHVPYKGSAPALNALMGGEISFMFDPTSSSLGFVRGGRLKALAQSGARRAAVLPDVPTVAEAGLPGYEITAWFGVLVPSRTPSPVVQKLYAEVKRALAAPDIRTKFADLGADPGGDSPQAFARYVRDEIPMWAKVIKDAGISVQ